MAAKTVELTNCKAQLKNDTLTLENELISRKYRWNKGHLISISITDKLAKYTWKLDNSKPDSFFPGEGNVSDGQFSFTETPATSISPAYLKAEVTVLLGKLYVKKVFRIYPSCPAIACDYYLKGESDQPWRTTLKETGNLINIENHAALADGVVQPTVIEKLNLPGRHWQVKAIAFYDITDRNNNLVETNTQWVYRGESRLSGNLLFIGNQLDDHRLFIVKEAPTREGQLNYPGFDFSVRVGEILTAGVGLDSKDLKTDTWTRCYGIVTGVATGTEQKSLIALRNYQSRLRIHKPNRDEMILLNTWGDRNQDKSVGEKFVLGEIEAGKKLGITHFQIDDGWQAGKSGNSAFAGGTFKKIWDNPAYWLPDKTKFPNGLSPVVDAGKKAGIEICLWFNPSKDDDYANWQKDANALIYLYKTYGIRTFKIDGVQVDSKRAEVNVRKILDTVMSVTNNEAVFNLDVTAGKRYGYHFFNEYGNIFLENRYTDYGNYYPFWTLRNLWMLSKYVPAQNLQIEFLNNTRNTKNYINDPLAPGTVSFEYLFAITMMAQPLAWFEASNLPKEAFNIAPTVKKYRELQQKIHQGQIFPIGEEPNGTTWTGFQSQNGNSGYVLVYREKNKLSKFSLSTLFKPGTKVAFKSILGIGKSFSAIASVKGTISFNLPTPNSYALYSYEILK